MAPAGSSRRRSDPPGRGRRHRQQLDAAAVSEVRGRGLRELERLLEITRLGDRVDAAGELNEAAMGRVEVVRARVCRAGPRAGCITPADRRNQRRPRRRERPGFPGPAGAALRSSHAAPDRRAGGAHDAAGSHLAATAAGTAVVCDIGGGSTELIAGSDGAVIVRDQPRHGMRPHERATLASDPPDDRELRSLRDEVASRCCRRRARGRADRSRRHGYHAGNDRPGTRPRDPRGDRRAPAGGRRRRGRAGTDWRRCRWPSAVRCAD